MKRILLVMFIVLVCTSTTYAKDLNDPTVLDSFHLSNQVSGVYFTDANQSQYIIYTGHAKGNTMYGSGSFVTAIYANTADVSAPFTSADFPGTPGTDFTSGAFTTNWIAK